MTVAAYVFEDNKAVALCIVDSEAEVFNDSETDNEARLCVDNVVVALCLDSTELEVKAGASVTEDKL